MPDAARSPLVRRYRLHCEVVSPLHVGGGQGDLRPALDFWTERDRFCVADLSSEVFALLPDDLVDPAATFQLPSIVAKIRNHPGLAPNRKAEILERLTRYVLTPVSPDVASIIPVIKDMENRPYVPGSALKGAIRTALAWKLVSEGRVEVQPGDLGGNPRYADDSLMSRLFGGPGANFDLLRALRVADSSPAERLRLERVEVYSLRQQGLQGKGGRFAFHVETVPAGCSTEAELTIDDFLLTGRAAERLGFDGRAGDVDRWLDVCREFGSHLIDAELRFYRQVGPFGRPLEAFYRQLQGMVVGLAARHECLLQISWGAGWTAKTIAMALSDQTQHAIRERYRLGRAGVPAFPKSRRLVGPPGRPTAPLGWLKIRVEEARDATPLPR
ncbi:MAG TPA: type III-A CRISPR-associated RAMP protein Csm5 [Candidatus Acidoferrum sp.]|nr:type III-A CRISPR-associated RAMP protein Csm5 [Candidatus Acidoferrum sp.]